jgi:peptidoglycan/xylan/chitin deacetylase (PgdA/CDA1 family)
VIVASSARRMDIEARRTRREASRRAARRRRAAGLGALALVVLAAVVVIATHGARSSSPNTSARTHTASSSPATRSTRSAHGRAVAIAPATGRPGQSAIPILMYHVIAAPPAGAPFPGLYVAPDEFAAQMQTLHEAGWHAVTLDQAEAYWHSGATLGSGKPIVVSFDNGYQSQYTQALPVLRRLGWVGDENIQLTGLPPSQGGLGDGEIRGLIAAGWELDTQGISHADLITLDARELREQTAGARETLRKRFHVPVNWFCYPSGHYDASVIAAVKAAGFAGSTTVVPGWASPHEDPYRLHRLRVLGGTSPQELLSLLAGIRRDPPAPPSYNGT